jgi:hypothetical protein
MRVPNITLLACTLLVNAAHAQSLSFFAQDAVVDYTITTDYTIVGFESGQFGPGGFNDTSEFAGESSPTVRFAASATQTNLILGYNSSIIEVDGTMDARILMYDDFTLRMKDTASIYQVYGMGAKRLDVSQGNIKDLFLRLPTEVTVGGTGNVDQILAGDRSRIQVSGGQIRAISMQYSSTADITGGTVQSVSIEDGASARVHGGTVGVVGVSHFSNLTISGGSLRAVIVNGYYCTANISGGTFSEFFEAFIGGTLNFWGTNLTATLFASDETYNRYHLSGTLLDGSVLNNVEVRVHQNYGAQLNLYPVPSPGGIVLLTAPALLKRRRR